MIEMLFEVCNLSKMFCYWIGWFCCQIVEVVKFLSFMLCEGQILVIIGENGLGKFMLVKMLVGMIEFISGELLIDDYLLYFGDYFFCSQCICMIFQDFLILLNFC